MRWAKSTGLAFGQRPTHDQPGKLPDPTGLRGSVNASVEHHLLTETAYSRDSKYWAFFPPRGNSLA